MRHARIIKQLNYLICGWILNYKEKYEEQRQEGDRWCGMSGSIPNNISRRTIGKSNMRTRIQRANIIKEGRLPNMWSHAPEFMIHLPELEQRWDICAEVACAREAVEDWLACWDAWYWRYYRYSDSRSRWIFLFWWQIYWLVFKFKMNIIGNQTAIHADPNINQ